MIRFVPLILLAAWLSLLLLPVVGQEQVPGWGSEWTRHFDPYESASLPFQESFQKALERKKYPAALNIANQWIAAQPGNPESHWAAGMACYKSGDYVRSNAAYSDVLKLKDLPANFRSLGLISRAEPLVKMERYVEAKADLQTALALDDTPSSQNSLAWFLATCPDASLRDGKSAMRHATLAVNRSRPNSPSYSAFIDTLAAACAETADFTAAIKWQQTAIRINKDPEIKTGMVRRLQLFEKKQPYRTNPKMED